MKDQKSSGESERLAYRVASCLLFFVFVAPFDLFLQRPYLAFLWLLTLVVAFIVGDPRNTELTEILKARKNK